VDPDGKKLSEYQPYESVGKNYAFGELMGSYRGIDIISAGKQVGRADHPYQCTTLAKEFSLAQFGVNLKQTGNGGDFGNQDKISNAFDTYNKGNPGIYSVYKNGSTAMPQENDIISWSGNEYGHVGFIAEVSFDQNTGTGWVYSIEQNMSKNQAIFPQPLTRSYNDKGQGIYTIGKRLKSYNVNGWARYENQSTESSPENYTSTPHTPTTKTPLPMSIPYK
jgi:hypothetical protein